MCRSGKSTLLEIFKDDFYGKLLNFKPTYVNFALGKWAVVTYDLTYENVNATFEILDDNSIKIFYYKFSAESKKFIINSTFSPIRKALIERDKDKLYNLSLPSFKKEYPKSRADSLFKEIFRFRINKETKYEHGLVVYKGVKIISIGYKFPLIKKEVNIILCENKGKFQLENLNSKNIKPKATNK